MPFVIEVMKDRFLLIGWIKLENAFLLSIKIRNWNNYCQLKRILQLTQVAKRIPAASERAALSVGGERRRKVKQLLLVLLWCSRSSRSHAPNSRTAPTKPPPGIYFTFFKQLILSSSRSLFINSDLFRWKKSIKITPFGILAREKILVFILKVAEWKYSIDFMLIFKMINFLLPSY